MEDLGGKIGRALVMGMVVVAVPFVWVGDKVANVLKKLGVDNPPHDSTNDHLDNPFQP